MKVSFEGIGEKIMTFEAQTGVEAGDLVKMAANGTVAACAENDVPVGVAKSVRDGLCGVQVGGYVQVACASGVSVGFASLGCDKNGKLASVTGGRAGFVLDVDSTNGKCGVLF